MLDRYITPESKVIKPPNYYLISYTQNEFSKIGIDYNFFSQGEGNDFFNKLVGQINWDYNNQRKIKWYGNCPYIYGRNIKHPACSDWPKELLQIKQKLECQLNAKVNSVLLNYYEHNHHHVKFHMDNEPIFGSHPVIYSLSFGGARDFILGPKECRDSNKNQIKIRLTSGSLLIMKDALQIDWYHCVLPATYDQAPRINATFRLTI